jgi:hypothetical protein
MANPPDDLSNAWRFADRNTRESVCDSKVPEQTISKEAILDEIRQELAAIERYEQQHGSFPDLVRAYYTN